MNATLTIDKAGRIVLPKPVRDALQIESSEDHIVLRPAPTKGRMYKKQGMWVFDSGSDVPLSAEVVNQTIRRVRAERDRHVLGKFKK